MIKKRRKFYRSLFEIILKFSKEEEVIQAIEIISKQKFYLKI